MANIDKNIVITPNISNTSEPKIVFTGGNNNPTTLRVLDDGTLSFEGGAGQLFSISNTATGQIFAVNDISGYPLSEVYSNGFVSLARSYGRVVIGNNTAATAAMTILANNSVSALDIQYTSSPQATGYLRTPSGTRLTFNTTNELVLLNLNQLRFSDAATWSYDSWGGLKWFSANNTMIIGGPGATGMINNTVVSANLIMHNATTGNFMVANSSATNLFVGANGNVGIGNTTPAHKLRIEAGSLSLGNTTSSVTISIPTTVEASATNYFMNANGSWAVPASAVSAGGSNTHIQFNDSGTISGSAGFTFNKTSGNVGIGNTTPDATLAITGTANISGNVVIGGSATIAGNLTVSGTTTYINTTTLNIGDNIITLNADLGAAAPTENAGIEINRGTSANVALRWNETTDEWQTTVDGSTYLKVASNSDVVTAYSNATSFASNASNLSTGILPTARLSGAYGLGNTTITGFANVSSTINIGTDFVANTTALLIGNTTVNTVITQTTAAFNTNSTATALTMLANGNIGIGVAAPQAQLHVESATPTIWYKGTGAGSVTHDIYVSNTNFGFVETLRIGGTQRSSVNINASQYQIATYGTSNSLFSVAPSGTQRFYVSNDGVGGPNNFFISANGNVGIGNTTPADKLVITGNLRLTEYTETAFVANSSTAITLALTNGTVQIITLTGTATITMPAAVAGKSFALFLKQDATGSRTVTWSTVKWPGGTAPTITSTASKQDIFSFFSDGTSWFGATIGQNYTP